MAEKPRNVALTGALGFQCTPLSVNHRSERAGSKSLEEPHWGAWCIFFAQVVVARVLGFQTGDLYSMWHIFSRPLRTFSFSPLPTPVSVSLNPFNHGVVFIC